MIDCHVYLFCIFSLSVRAIKKFITHMSKQVTSILYLLKFAFTLMSRTVASPFLNFGYVTAICSVPSCFFVFAMEVTVEMYDCYDMPVTEDKSGY